MYKVVVVATQIKKIVFFSFVVVLFAVALPATAQIDTNSTTCQSLPDFGDQELNIEEALTTISFVGFPKYTIKYISAPNRKLQPKNGGPLL